MRPTLLQFRNPNERTGEYLLSDSHHSQGTDLSAGLNPRGTNLPKAARFTSLGFFDKATGQSVFTGPTSYNACEGFVRQTRTPTPGIIRPISAVGPNDNGKRQCIMIGDSIKHEPCLISDKADKASAQFLRTQRVTTTLAGKYC